MNHYAIFQLYKKNKIIIHLPYKLTDIQWGMEVKISLCAHKKSITVGLIDIMEFLNTFHDLLQKALNQKLFLDQSLRNNLGLAENEYMNALYNMTYENENNNDLHDNIWIGYDYDLCGFRHRQIWIFNDQWGRIILQMTPHYYSQIKKRKKRKSFKQWILNYKPLLTWIIPVSVAQKWLQQAKSMIKIIEKNDS